MEVAMASDEALRARLSVPIDAETTQRRLLQSVVQVIRTVFGAAAASVFLVDPRNGDLVFEAVAGEGEDSLIGTRFPGGTGIAGWVAESGQPVLVDDLSGNPMFAREAAESTGYVPDSIMAAPLLQEGECIGVLQVLDRGTCQRSELDDIGALGLLATQMAAALELVVRLRWAQANPCSQESAPVDAPLLSRLAQRLPQAPAPVAATATRLLALADELLADVEPVPGPARA
jgi:GAF domain-containing protein